MTIQKTSANERNAIIYKGNQRMKGMQSKGHQIYLVNKSSYKLSVITFDNLFNRSVPKLVI
jgi:hypothetical protein